jgi:hypothetical protein
MLLDVMKGKALVLVPLVLDSRAVGIDRQCQAWMSLDEMKGAGGAEEGAGVAVSSFRPQFMGMGGTDSSAFLYTDSHLRQKGKNVGAYEPP